MKYFIALIKKLGLLAIIFISFSQLKAQEFISLWPKNKLPNSKGLNIKDSIVNERVYQIVYPGMYAFFPSKDDNCGAAILIFPGGGYQHLTNNLGGFQLAKWFNTLGISAFVVDYRLPNSPDLKQREIAPLQDAERALKIVRANAIKWGIKTNKIGVQGSSAGGHVASMIGTSAEDISIVNDSLDGVSFKPNFMVLISAVIDMGKYAHAGSKLNLLGLNPSPELINKYSTQNNVTANTPPCFMADAFNDKTVQPINSLLFYKALLENNISSSFHVFPQGGHAIGVNNNPGSTDLWKPLCEAWLKEMGIIVFDKNK